MPKSGKTEKEEEVSEYEVLVSGGGGCGQVQPDQQGKFLGLESTPGVMKT